MLGGDTTAAYADVTSYWASDVTSYWPGDGASSGAADVISYVAVARGNASAPEAVTLSMLLNSSAEASLPAVRACVACSYLPLGRFISAVVVSTPLIVLGVLANVFAFVVLCFQRQRPPTTVLLQALAIVDTVVLLLMLLQYALPVLASHTLWSPAGMRLFVAVRTYLYPCIYFSRLANTWVTVLLSVHRYVAVCRPRRAGSITRLAVVYRNIALVLLLSAVFSLPRCFEYTLRDMRMQSTALLRSRHYIVGYRIVLFSTCMYLLPMTILVWLTSRLCRQLREVARFETVTHQQTRALTSGGGRSRDTTTSSTVVVVTLVSICVACNLTAFVAHLLWSLHTSFASMRHLDVPRRYVTLVSNALVTFNSAVNFFIYCACSRSFRRSCVALVVSRWRSARNASGHHTASTSNGTNGTYGTYPLTRIDSGRTRPTGGSHP